MEEIVEQYKIGKISVTIRESGVDGRLEVECNDGTFHSRFTVSRYEYSHYKRHMNQKILNAFKEGHGQDGG